MTRLRITISALALALVSLYGVRPAHAFIEAIGWLGYGNNFQEGDDSALGPTVEVGGGLSVLFVTIDLTYWTDLDDTGTFNQLRLGGRIKPPLIPFYGRLAIGVPLDEDARDAQDADLVLGAGLQVISLGIIKLNFELDYHIFTSGIDVHPLEGKLGVVIGF